MDFGLAKLLLQGQATEKSTTLTIPGAVFGTPGAMSPEQALGQPVDQRSDVFSFGSLLYEMAANRPAFEGKTANEIIDSVIHSDPLPLTSIRTDLPRRFAAVVARSMRKDVSERYQSMADVVDGLREFGSATGPHRRSRLLAVSVPVVLTLLAIWYLLGDGRAAWARKEALPEIEALVEAGDWEGAFQLAKQVEEAIPGDPELGQLRSTFVWRKAIETDPPGARVLRRNYSAVDGPWEDLGITPLPAAAIPFGASRLRVELDGHRTVEWVSEGPADIRIRMDPVDALPEEMVRVPGGSVVWGDQQFQVDDFFMDRYEVTNRDYQAFVDAGAYEDRAFWGGLFDAAPVSWEEAMNRFRDETRRHGPSTWTAGRYPEGQEDHPVGGISWFEAAAYARFVGKDLPTIHHWRRAVGRNLRAWIIPMSNLEGTEAAPVGGYPGMGAFGTFDMVGNVREWCFNGMGEQRIIPGGGWNDPYYSGTGDFYAQQAWDRAQTNGVRLVRYLADDELLDRARLPISFPRDPDYESEDPISDELFDTFRRDYEYDPTPLDARKEGEAIAKYWVREKVSFAAAYGDERVILYLYLPREAEPPYQAVVYFPGSGAVTQRSIDEWRTVHLDFAVKSGRAVAFPVYKGTFERGSELESTFQELTYLYRDHVHCWAKDLRRTIDYLETRDDIDAQHLAYYGYSWGGSVAPIMLAVEPRFDAAVLYVAGFSPQKCHPDVDPVNFATRVKTPVLMLSGRYDAVFPPDTRASPMFRRFGTPDEHKKHVISDGGHFVPRTQLIGETLEWLDTYLGPVRPSR